MSELAYNEKRNAKLMEAAEKALAFEKEEVTRLYASLQVCRRMGGVPFQAVGEARGGVQAYASLPVGVGE